MRFIITFLFLTVVLVSGCTNIKTETTDNVVVTDKDDVVVGKDVVEEKEEAMVKKVTGTKLVIDKYKYISGGSDFNTASQSFVQESKKGFKVVINSDKQVEASIMDDKDCLRRNKGEEDYEVIETKQGLDITFENDEISEEKKSLCVYLKALDVGQISSHLVLEELSF